MSIPDPVSIRNNAGEVFAKAKIYSGQPNKMVARHSAAGVDETWSFSLVPTKTRNRILARYDWTGTPDGVTGVRPTQSVNITLDMPLTGPNAYLDANIESIAATTRYHLSRLLNGEI